MKRVFSSADSAAVAVVRTRLEQAGVTMMEWDDGKHAMGELGYRVGICFDLSVGDEDE